MKNKDFKGEKQKNPNLRVKYVVLVVLCVIIVSFISALLVYAWITINSTIWSLLALESLLIALAASLWLFISNIKKIKKQMKRLNK